MQRLLEILQLAQACQFQELEEQCLGLAADKLAAVGGHWEAFVEEDDLAALDSGTLARLLGKTLQSKRAGRHPPQQVCDTQAFSDGTAGSFTFAIAGFSSKRGITDGIQSPWVEVGGFEWFLHVFPSGHGADQGTYMSGDWIEMLGSLNLSRCNAVASTN